MKKLFTLAVVTALLLLIGSGAAFAQVTAPATATDSTNVTLTLNGVVSVNLPVDLNLGSANIPDTTTILPETAYSGGSRTLQTEITVLGLTGPWRLDYSCTGLSDGTHTIPLTIQGASAFTSDSGPDPDTNVTFNYTAAQTILPLAGTTLRLVETTGSQRGLFVYDPTLSVQVGPDAHQNTYNGIINATLYVATP